MPNKPLDAEALLRRHQTRIFFAFHQRHVSEDGTHFVPTVPEIPLLFNGVMLGSPFGWADAAITAMPGGRAIAAVELCGIGQFRPPLKDGSILVDADHAVFLNIFIKKAECEGWMAGIHGIKREGFLARFFGR